MQSTRRELLVIATNALALAPRRLVAAQTPLALPTPAQVEWHDREIEMFIHWGPATWENVQHSNLTAPLSAINPEKADTDQWADLAVSMGAGMIIFVAKHDGGFCWWQTGTTEYSVKNTPWRGGKGDVMRDLAASCRKRNIGLGVYLSPADRKRNIGVGGRAKTPEEQALYENIYRRQLTELLSRYGPIQEVWFDGSLVVPVGDILSRYAPAAMVFQGPHATIRWAGNESGTVPYPAWNSVRSTPESAGTMTQFDSDPDGDLWLPLECDGRIRADWFWSTGNAGTLKSVDKLMDMYYRSVGHGAVLLLNQTPDTTGLIPETDVRRAAEFGAEIRRRFGRSLAETAGRGPSVELSLGRPQHVDHVVTMEDIRQGERVREYIVEGWSNGQWKPLCDGTAIGHKKIDRFNPVEVSKVRARFTRSAAEPRIRKLAAYSVYGDQAPREVQSEILTATRTLWKWSSDNVKSHWTTQQIDLSPFCKEAGVYVLQFVSTGNEPIEVQSVSLSSEGTPLDGSVKKARHHKGEYFLLTITAEGSAHRLHVVARAPAGAHGYATIYRRLE